MCWHKHSKIVVSIIFNFTSNSILARNTCKPHKLNLCYYYFSAFYLCQMSLIMRLMVVLPSARKASSEAANLTERKRHITMYVTVGTDKPLACLIFPPFVCGKGSGTSIRNIGYIFCFVFYLQRMV